MHRRPVHCHPESSRTLVGAATTGFHTVDILNVTDEFELDVLLEMERIAFDVLLTEDLLPGASKRIRVFRNALLHVALEYALISRSACCQKRGWLFGC